MLGRSDMGCGRMYKKYPKARRQLVTICMNSYVGGLAAVDTLTEL